MDHFIDYSKITNYNYIDYKIYPEKEYKLTGDISYSSDTRSEILSKSIILFDFVNKYNISTKLSYVINGSMTIIFRYGNDHYKKKFYSNQHVQDKLKHNTITSIRQLQKIFDTARNRDFGMTTGCKDMIMSLTSYDTYVELTINIQSTDRNITPFTIKLSKK